MIVDITVKMEISGAELLALKDYLGDRDGTVDRHLEISKGRSEVLTALYRTIANEYERVFEI